MASAIDLTAFEGMPLQDIIACAFDLLDHVCPLCLYGLEKNIEKNNFSQHVGVNKNVASSKKAANHACAPGGTDIPVQALGIMAVYVLELDAVKKPEYAAYPFVGIAAFLCHLLKARDLLPIPEASQLQLAQLPPSSELVKMARKKLREHYQLQPDKEWEALQEALPDFPAAGKDPSPALAQLYPMMAHMVSVGRNSAAQRPAVIAAYQQPPELRWIPTHWEELQVLLSLARVLDKAKQPGQPEPSEDQMSLASLLDESSLDFSSASDAEDDAGEGEADEAAESGDPSAPSGSKAKAKARASAPSGSKNKKQRLREHFQEMEAEKSLACMEEELLEELKHASGKEGFIDFMAQHLPKSAAEINNQGSADSGDSEEDASGNDAV